MKIGRTDKLKYSQFVDISGHKRIIEARSQIITRRAVSKFHPN